MKHILQHLSEGKSLSFEQINSASERLFSKEITDSEFESLMEYEVK